MGIQGYEGYEGYELLPEKPDTFFHGDTGIRGIRESPRKTRHIFSWGYADTRDTKNTRVSQKNQTHVFIGIQGYRDTRPSVGGTRRKSETRETKHLENHGDTGIRGIRRIRELSQKNQTHFFMGIRGYEGYESSPRKTRHIFEWEYEDTGIPDPL